MARVRSAGARSGQFSRYGVLGPGDLPGPGDERICAVEFECNLPAMLEEMLDASFVSFADRYTYIRLRPHSGTTRGG
jgi:hypothetical protein